MQSSNESSRNLGAPSPETAPEASPIPPASTPREPWVRPRLQPFGDVRQVTMGGTTGINESGNPNRFP